MLELPLQRASETLLDLNSIPKNVNNSSSYIDVDDVEDDEEDCKISSQEVTSSSTPKTTPIKYIGEKCKNRLSLQKKFKPTSAKRSVKKDVKISIAGRVWGTLTTVRRASSSRSSRINVVSINENAVIKKSAEVLAGDEVIAKFTRQSSLTIGEYNRGSSSSGNTRSIIERGRLSGCGSGDHHADSIDDPSSKEDISEMVQQNVSSKPKTSNINRSESYRERIHNKRQLREKRKTSDPNLSKTNDCDAAGAFPGGSAGSSSNSSLSTRSLDSPSTSLEHVHPSSTANASNNASASWDSDVDVEPDPPDWSQSVSEEVLTKLTNTEKKRQEVINELFHTERSHVRALKVLSQVFHKPLLESQVLPLDQINLLFSNLDEMVNLHSQFNQAMKRKRKENPVVEEVGDLLLETFDGESGEVFEKAASKYCAKQQVALRSLRDQRRKDPKLNSFLNDVESNPLCRRLQLKDHILTGMLRLTKYPLLFENLAKYTQDANEKEKTAILRSLDRSKEILSRVNQSVKDAEDQHRLYEIQRTIDRSAFDKFEHPCVQEFKNLDITKRRLVHEGPLQWRVVKGKPVDLHVVLLDDTILLLHRQDDNKYALKFINQMNSVLSPIVKVSTVLVRHNAVDNNSLYLVNTSTNGAQIYDLVASSPAERKLWLKHISEATEAYKARDREGRRPMPSNSSASDLAESPEEQLLPEPETEKEKRKEDNVDNVEENKAEVEGKEKEEERNEVDNKDQKKADQEDNHPSTNNDSIRLVTCKCSIIDPVEVHVEERPVHIAEPVLTPIESLRRKDEAIKQALMEKQSIVSDILNIQKPESEQSTDTPEVNLDKDPAELLFLAIEQTNRLVELLNSTLTVSESDIVFASQNPNATSPTAACEATGCPAPRVHQKSLEPSIPVSVLQPFCHSLNSNLSQLLKIVNEREEERDRLRSELRRSRERLHAIDFKAQKRGENSEVPQDSMPQISADTTTEETSNITQAEPTVSEELSKDVFVDAESELEVSTTTDLVEDIKISLEDKEVMGDSVG